MDYNKHKELIGGVKILIMVVESNEYNAAMHYFVKGEVKGLTVEDGTTYYVGKWGKIPAALVHVAGKSTEDPTKKAIKLFHTLETIIALGVCGTTKYAGCVLVSDKIYKYCKQELPSGNIFDTSDFAEPVSRIFELLHNNYVQWSFVCTEEGDNKSEAKFVPMLSGTNLTASREDQDKLIHVVNEEGFGVEMGGKGILSGIKEENKKTDFIIVKGGCNYANKDKSEKWQPTAAMAAADFLYSQLNKSGYEQLFKCEGIAM